MNNFGKAKTLGELQRVESLECLRPGVVEVRYDEYRA